MTFPKNPTIIFLSRIDSTNTHLKRHLDVFSSHLPLFLLAQSQSLGRGRNQRSWDSPPGGFYGTLGLNLPPACPLSHGLLSLLVGIGTCDVLTELLPNQRFDLKWPNDVHCHGKKVAGILVENQVMGQSWVSLWGVGINLCRSQAPFIGPLKLTATSLAELGCSPPSPLSLARLLYQRYCYWLEIWQQGNIELIRTTIHGYIGHFLKHPITFHDRDQIIVGMIERIDDDGSLWLRRHGDERAQKYYNGEINPDSL